MKKICFVSSSGGHWEELMCLNEIAEMNDSFFVTEQGGQVVDFKKRIYIIKQINRKESMFFFCFIKLFIQSFGIIIKERPNVIITTGALVSYPFCVIGKIMNAKIIYIESFARVTEPSLTGRMVYPFADLFLVQWESLLKVYPKAKYVGGVF